MNGLWSLGGLTWRELLIRTVRESWDDNVFGQAARLAFYHFLALFPSLLLVFLIAQPGSGPESALRRALADAVQNLLPARVSELMNQTVSDLHRSALRSSGIWIAVLSALWASVNGSYAVIDALNVAYEVEERRSWQRVASLSIGLTLLVALLALFAITAGQYAVKWNGESASAVLSTIVRWVVVTISLFICFAIFFRLGPNLKSREWQWTTPGAVVAAVIWIGGTVGFRFWMDHFNSYPRIYGRIAPAVSLLVWLYITGAAVLIGGEMNSEIEKAAAEGGRDKEVSRKK